MKKNILQAGILGLFSFVFLLVVSPALADTVCNPTYGGGEQCISSQWSINKMVLNPATNSYVDNLTLSDTKFGPGNTVWFRIQYTNTGSATIGVFKVTDTLPGFIDLNSVTGPVTVDKASGKMTFEVNSLDPGQTKETIISAKVAGVNALPATSVCPVNYVSASADRVSTISDSAQFCIQKTAAKVVATPATGASEWILAGLTGMLGAGWVLKKSRKVAV